MDSIGVKLAVGRDSCRAIWSLKCRWMMKEWPKSCLKSLGLTVVAAVPSVLMAVQLPPSPPLVSLRVVAVVVVSSIPLTVPSKVEEVTPGRR